MNFKNFREGISISRGLSLLFVIHHHTLSFIKFSYKIEQFDNVYLNLYAKFLSTYISDFVFFFFIMSSYLLTEQFYKYQQIYTAPVKSFYIKRFIRIFSLWPIAVLCFYYYKTEIWKLELPLKYVLMNFTFIFGFFPGSLANFTIMGWSCFNEELFYLYGPLLLLWRNKYFYLFLSIILMGWIYPLDFYNHVSEPVSMYTRAFNKNLHFFTLGIFLYFIFRQGEWEKKKLIPLSFLIAIMLYFGHTNAFFLALIVILSDKVPLKYLDIFGFFSFLGNRCYFAYLFHFFAIFPILSWSDVLEVNTITVMLSLILIPLIVMFFAHLSWKYYEGIFIKYFNNRWVEQKYSREKN